MTAASKAVEIATDAARAEGYYLGILIGWAALSFMFALMSHLDKQKKARKEYEATLTDSEYRKYKQLRI